MQDFLTYLAGPIVAVAWIRYRPVRSLGRLLLLWLTGLIAARVLLGAVLAILDRDPRWLTILLVFVEWAGGILLLVALWTLVHIDRPRSGLRWKRIAFNAAFLGAGLAPSVWFLFVPVALPLLLSFRWRERLGAGGLLLANGVGLLSFLLAMVQFTPDIDEFRRQMAGLSGFATHVSVLAGLYGLLSLPLTGSRIHLSIRRIGRRLIGSHVLAALIPFTLAVLFLLLTSGLYLSTYRCLIASRTLQEEGESVRARLVASLAAGAPLPDRPFGSAGGAQVLVWEDEQGVVRSIGNGLAVPPESLLAFDEPSAKVPLLWDGRRLWLRARVDSIAPRGEAQFRPAGGRGAERSVAERSVAERSAAEKIAAEQSAAGQSRAGRSAARDIPTPPPDSRPVRLEALAQVDSTWMAQLSRSVGRPVQIHPRVVVSSRGTGVSFGRATDMEGPSGDDESPPEAGPEEFDASESASGDRPAVESAENGSRPATPGGGDGEERAGSSIGPSTPSGWSIPGGATVHCARYTRDGWTDWTIPLSSSARIGEQVSSLFTVASENPIATVILVALALISILFLAAISVATGVVLAMGRSITRAVRALTGGARALQAGDLEHRIPLEGRDELWDVAGSFNEMAEGLQRIRSMELSQQRLEEELHLARVIQNRLLPASAPKSDRVELAGLSLPAREVGGDYYDYLQLEDGRVGLAVADVSGKGAPAALLMSAFRASLRSQDLGQLGPAEAIGRINRFIHASVDPGKFITAFLGLYDPATGELRYANAGHDAPLVVRPDGRVEELTGGGLILGLLPQIAYEEAVAQIDPGSLLAVYTDGVTEARSEEGEFFGPERLVDLLKTAGREPCAAILQKLVDAISAFAGNGPQADDITVILARRT